jgi:hypothetical protein
MLGVKPPAKKPIDAPPALSAAEIRELQMREICPDDYHLLLKLDDISETPQQRKRRARPPVQNQRIQAANQIIGHSTLEVTGTVMKGTQTEHERHKVVKRERRPTLPMCDFAGEITGIGVFMFDAGQRQQPAEVERPLRSRPGVPARLERPRMVRSRSDAEERGLFVHPF